MSILGKLTDLTLTELLQTIALSRKTGVLEICSEDEIAWIGMIEGGIVRIAFSERVIDRETVLKQNDLAADAERDTIDACLWDSAVAAILSVFEWRCGEFTFNSNEDPDQIWRGPEGLRLPTPLSPEFLALEGARIEDEIEGDGGVQGEVADEWEDSLSEAPEDASAGTAVGESAPEQDQPSEPQAGEEEESGIAAIVAVDSDLLLLEAIKQASNACGMTAHLLGDGELAIQRIKYYALKGKVPALVIAEGLGEDSTSPEERWDRLIERAHRMVSGAPIILLRTKKSPLRVDVTASIAKGDLRRGASDAREQLARELLATLGLDP